MEIIVPNEFGESRLADENLIAVSDSSYLDSSMRPAHVLALVDGYFEGTFTVQTPSPHY
ncbi:MAG TPA: hypothetical protein VJQ83_02375 [Tepidiformaceae bacterium]|nr:hypothetical protein [Tepidiformaceae bacterium]